MNCWRIELKEFTLSSWGEAFFKFVLYSLSMVFRVYNTLTKKKEVFRPLRKQHVGIYTCGPTVYQYPHIGNYRTMVSSDLVVRYLEFKGYNVKWVLNITDVEDKIIKASAGDLGKMKKLTKFYEREFFREINMLNIEKAYKYPRATEHIKEMVSLIQSLLDKGIAYLGEDGSIYYSVRKFKNYGKLSGVKPGKSKKLQRISHDEYGKEDVSDFALWKAWKNEDGEIYWNAEFRIKNKKIKIKGRPGWHIECSVMSMKYLGKSFDIHTGGVDLIFPHHENEIAQAEGATNKQFVKNWIHMEHLLVEGEKMSKSLKNDYKLREIMGWGYSPLDLRFLYITTHYRSLMNFTRKSLEAARKNREKLQNIYEDILVLERLYKKGSKKTKTLERFLKKFEEKMDDDLNTPEALAILHEFLSFVEKNREKIRDSNFYKKAREILLKTDNVFSVLEREPKIDFVRVCEEAKDIEKTTEIQKALRKKTNISRIKELLKIRNFYRNRKEWKKSDKIRSFLNRLGYEVRDSRDVVVFKKI